MMERRGFFGKLLGGITVALGIKPAFDWYRDKIPGVCYNTNPRRLCRVLPSDEDATDVLLRIKAEVDNNVDGYLSMIDLQATPTNYGTGEPHLFTGPDGSRVLKVFQDMEKEHMASAMEVVGWQVEHLLEAVRQKDALDAAMAALA